MPGASTHPLRQDFNKRRFFFSGTPYGDFDCIPVEANQNYVNGYELLLHLGWNTFILEDYNKLKNYVLSGGVLLTGIPQFSTHVKRDFLLDMNDLALYNGGDLTEFCGIKVLGKGAEYCGKWDSNLVEEIVEPTLSAIPSDSKDEDGKALLAEVTLCGAEVVAWDYNSKKPLLVRNKFGKGYVYTFTIWAYPGHELFQKFTAFWVQKLSSDTLNDAFVIDQSKEIFWTIRKDKDTTSIFMLNTDWTKKGNVKEVIVFANGISHPVSVKERTLVRADITGDNFNVTTYEL
jgi:hypothetical protein